MAEVTTTQVQAEFFAALAEHLRVHPHLGVVMVTGRRYPTVTVGGCEDAPGEHNAGALAAWAWSFGAPPLRVVAVKDRDWSAVEFDAELGGLSVQVWASVSGLAGGVTALGVQELEHFVEHGVLPGASSAPVSGKDR